MKWPSFLLLLVVLTAYLLLGGLVFHLLESNNNVNTCNLAQRLETILTTYRPLIEGTNATNTSSQQALMLDLRAASDCQLYNSTKPPMSYSDGVYLSLTIMAAIGYGYYYPRTIAGKAVTMIYSFTAIPLFMMTSAVIGEKMQRAAAKMLTNETLDKWNIKSRKARLIVKMLFLLVVGQLLFIFLPAIGVMFLENWTYFDCYYFMVVTFLTVGFGDLNVALVVDAPWVEAYRVVYYISTLLGISFIASLIQTVIDALKTKTEELEQKITELSKKIHVGPKPQRAIGSLPAFNTSKQTPFFFGSTALFGMDQDLDLDFGPPLELPFSAAKKEAPRAAGREEEESTEAPSVEPSVIQTRL